MCIRDSATASFGARPEAARGPRPHPTLASGSRGVISATALLARQGGEAMAVEGATSRLATTSVRRR
eukprot:13699555-Alexandrium_andersonii.AAC.1